MGLRRTQRAAKARRRSQSFRNWPPNSRRIAHASGNRKQGRSFPNGAGNEIDPDSLLRRVILPALEVCEFCSKPESEHGSATHQHERNKVLPAWCGDQPDSPGRRRFSNSANPASQQRRGYITCYIQTASEDAKAAMQKLETAINNTYVTPRQPVPGTKRIICCPARCFATLFAGWNLERSLAEREGTAPFRGMMSKFDQSWVTGRAATYPRFG